VKFDECTRIWKEVTFEQALNKTHKALRELTDDGDEERKKNDVRAKEPDIIEYHGQQQGTTKQEESSRKRKLEVLDEEDDETEKDYSNNTNSNAVLLCYPRLYETTSTSNIGLFTSRQKRVHTPAPFVRQIEQKEGEICHRHGLLVQTSQEISNKQGHHHDEAARARSSSGDQQTWRTTTANWYPPLIACQHSTSTFPDQHDHMLDTTSTSTELSEQDHSCSRWTVESLPPVSGTNKIYYPHWNNHHPAAAPPYYDQSKEEQQRIESRKTLPYKEPQGQCTSMVTATTTNNHHSWFHRHDESRADYDLFRRPSINRTYPEVLIPQHSEKGGGDAVVIDEHSHCQSFSNPMNINVPAPIEKEVLHGYRHPPIPPFDLDSTFSDDIHRL